MPVKSCGRHYCLMRANYQSSTCCRVFGLSAYGFCYRAGYALTANYFDHYAGQHR
jgi:hypothetical protein